MKFSLRQMEVFEAVARLGSVSAAAGEVALSQSAASLAVQDLERALNVPLFNRHRKQLTLNENGRRLLPQAKTLLAQAREIEQEGEDLSGVLRIATTGIISGYALPVICGRFLAAHPDVQIKLTILPEPEIIEGVENMVHDLGFIEGITMRHMLTVEPWLEDEMVVIAAPNHWACGRRVRMTDLGRERWFLHPIGAPSRHVFTNAHSSALAPGAICFETSSTEAIKRAAAAGHGLGCLSRRAVDEELRNGRLVALDVARFRLRRQFSAIARRDVYQGRLMKRFLAETRAD